MAPPAKNPYAEFQQPAASDPYAEFQAPATVPVATSAPEAPSAFSRIRSGIDRLSTPLDDPDASWLSNKAANFGAGVIGGTLGVINHPVDTITNLAHGVAHPIDTAKAESAAAKENPGKSIATNLGGLTGGILLGEAAGAGVKPLVKPVGEFLKSSGGKMIDRAAGSTAKDFSRGAQPGRAYLEGGGKPALTMSSLADKAEGVRDTAGLGLRNVYDTGTKNGITLPAPSVSSAVLDPAYKLRAIQDAPGGSGTSPLLDAYQDKLSSFLNSKSAFTPTEAFDLKSNISANTRWKDPTMFDMNTVRQQGVGALGAVLSDALPEAKPLNRIYQGANNLAGRATTRAATGSSPLTTMGRRAFELGAGAGAGMLVGHPGLTVLPMMLDSTPGMTTAGYGLFQAGRALPAIPGILPLAGAGAAAVRPKPKSDNNQ